MEVQRSEPGTRPDDSPLATDYNFGMWFCADGSSPFSYFFPQCQIFWGHNIGIYLSFRPEWQAKMHTYFTWVKAYTQWMKIIITNPGKPKPGMSDPRSTGTSTRRRPAPNDPRSTR